jgi:hypothetical protein
LAIVICGLTPIAMFGGTTIVRRSLSFGADLPMATCATDADWPYEDSRQTSTPPCNKLAAARPIETNRIAADKTIRSLSPHGMYDFYIQNGWPTRRFSMEGRTSSN